MKPEKLQPLLKDYELIYSYLLKLGDRFWHMVYTVVALQAASIGMMSLDKSAILPFTVLNVLFLLFSILYLEKVRQRQKRACDQLREIAKALPLHGYIGGRKKSKIGIRVIYIMYATISIIFWIYMAYKI